VHADLQAVKIDQKKRGFYGFNGDFFWETPFRKPLRGMGSGRATGFSGIYFNSWENIFLFSGMNFLYSYLPGNFF
jgi:hypothetical protein